MTWEGRRLISTTKNGALIQYSYDDGGLRVSKQDSNGITRYTYDNGRIVHQYTENNNVITNELFFRYDENGAPLSVNYNGTEYFYVLNLQGDIIGIINNAGALVVEYTYDSWGKHSLDNISGSMASTLGVINPLRYRGYYYDTDTGFYYCISRYYDPEVGRWISSDGLLSQETILGNNMFAYCLNNPINMTDTTGELPFFLITAAIGAIAGAVIGGVVAAVNGENVWAGIGIGAAAGGLVGAGLGAMAGVMLAGSVMASTTAVVSGAGMFATAVSTGGVGAGLTLIIDNISRALNNVGTVLYSGGHQAQEAASQFANNTGGTTIDSTVIGEVANAATEVAGANFTAIWSQASAAFCNQASGVVNAFISNGAYRGAESIFWSIEMPALLSNPRVTEIIIHIFD